MKTNRNVSVPPLVAALSTPVAPLTYNEKGALSYATTTSAVLDWFASGGAMRQEDESQMQAAFAKAFKEDKLLATKIAFYIRDIRGGQGQRKSFRAVLKWLADNSPGILRRNLGAIPFYGRWDDLFVLFGTPLEGDVLKLVISQLTDDLTALNTGEGVSLIAKWLPSENASSKETRAQAYKLIRALNLSPRQYRKKLVLLREKIKVVETFMCSKQWNQINYEHVPSRALMIYRKAFPKHDPVGFSQWKAKAFVGEAKVHSGTLYPYDVIHKVISGKWDETLELQWRNLPDYFTGKVHNGLVVCDVSGSMTSWLGGRSKTSVRPLDIAISLAMYMGERMPGLFKDYFITFSARPELQKIHGATLYEKAHNLSRADWQGNTDVQAVFDLILSKALENKLSQSDLPDAIYIVSDLQFDFCGFEQRNFDLIKDKFVKAGYQMPLLVFWQVRATQDKVALKNEKGVVMVSGFSPSALTAILKLEQPKEVTPMELMLKTINSERYSLIVP